MHLRLSRTLFFLLVAVVSLSEAELKVTEGSKKIPLPGESFQLNGRDAFVILPEGSPEEVPWVWYAPTLPGLPAQSEVWMFEQFLANGIAIAGIDVGESFGNAKGRETYSEFYKYLVSERGCSKKPCLLARSRGGLMLYSWAAENPDTVGGVAGIYPVCSIASYPGVKRAAAAYELNPEALEAGLSLHDPINRLKPLAEAGVPVFHIHGDVDTTVPLEANSAELAARYKTFGGPVEIEIQKGQGHNMWKGFFRSQKLTDFAIAAALGKNPATSRPEPVAHWKLDDKNDVAADSAGSHHGKILGAEPVPGKMGGALEFVRAEGDYVSVPFSEDFTISTFTVSARVFLTKAPTFSGVLGTRHGGDHTFDMKVNADKVHGDIGDGKNWIETAVNFYADDTGSNGEGGDLELNRWYHLVFVIDSPAKECRLYLDADLKKRIPFEGYPVLMTPQNTMHIGHSSGTEFMDGKIDEVKIFNRALTESQVQAEFSGAGE